MTKKKKIHLESIKVQSFITSMTGYEKRGIKGGVQDGTEPVDTCVPQTAGTTCPAITYPQTVCGCETLDCPTYICQESVTCN
jgi:hypothetical protein